MARVWVLQSGMQPVGELGCRRHCNRLSLCVEASRKSKAAKKEPALVTIATTSLPLLEEFSAGKSSVFRQQDSARSNGAASLRSVEEEEVDRRERDSVSLEEFLNSKLPQPEPESELPTVRVVPKSRTFLRKKKSVVTNRKPRVKDSDEGWDGEGPGMTVAEEAAFVAEAERELAELRSKHGELEGFDPREKAAKDWEDDSDSENSATRNSIPAVMRCFDRTKIFVKAGDGGNGEVAFRREKFVPFGGPSGGNGGRGGHVYIQVDSSLNSLLSFRKCVHFRAGRGNHGLGKGQGGAFGEDCVVKVPPGTLVREIGDEPGGGNILLELTKPGQKELLLHGGRGGRGNAAFKSTKNKTPQLSENGEEGVEMWIELELKLVADVGIVGVPNAGKSTLLSAITAAKPEIAAYPFTTLLPNLGVVSLGLDESMVVADLPGLLEGAHNGYGLGHEFLRHTERCRVLIHVVDGMSLQAECEYEAVRLELQLFNQLLSSKPCVVAYNKMDIPEVAERWPAFEEALRAKGIKVFCMSAATMKGTSEVVREAYELLKTAPDPASEVTIENVEVAERVRRERAAPIGEFTVTGDPDSEDKTWFIEGAGLERFVQMTNWEYFESMQRFERILQCSGVNAELRKKGVQEGDQVIIAEKAFTWHDSEDVMKDIINVGKFMRSSRGSKHWPH